MNFLGSHHQLVFLSKMTKAEEGVISPHQEEPNMELCLELILHNRSSMRRK